MKAKKQTAGEKFGRKWQLNRWATEALDALVRRAVREAWKARGEYSAAMASDTVGWTDTNDIRVRIERKYKVKLCK